jgi:hypothetical protein
MENATTGTAGVATEEGTFLARTSATMSLPQNASSADCSMLATS